MLEIKIKNITVEIRFLFFSVLTLFLLLDKTGYCFFLFLAGIIHELGHLLAFFITGYAPEKISFELCGIRLEKNNYDMSLSKQLIVLFAGSAVNFAVFFCLIFTLKSINALSVFAAGHLILGIVNLLPVTAFDGGKILEIILELILPPDKAQRLMSAIKIITLCLLFFAGATVFIQSGTNLSLFVLAVYVFISDLDFRGKE